MKRAPSIGLDWQIVADTRSKPPGLRSAARSRSGRAAASPEKSPPISQATKSGGDCLLIQLRLVSEANAHTHWRERQRRAKTQRHAVAWAWVAAGWKRDRKPVQVTITRLAPRSLDDDNLAGAGKHVRDEVAKLCGFDDRDRSVRWVYEQERSREYAVRIEVQW